MNEQAKPNVEQAPWEEIPGFLKRTVEYDDTVPGAPVPAPLRKRDDADAQNAKEAFVQTEGEVGELPTD